LKSPHNRRRTKTGPDIRAAIGSFDDARAGGPVETGGGNQ